MDLIIIGTILWVLVLGAYLFDRKKRKWADDAFDCWQATKRACEKWQKDNPFESESHPKAQELLLIQMGACMLWMERANVKSEAELRLIEERIVDWTA